MNTLFSKDYHSRTFFTPFLPRNYTPNPRAKISNDIFLTLALWLIAPRWTTKRRNRRIFVPPLPARRLRTSHIHPIEIWLISLCYISRAVYECAHVGQFSRAIVRCRRLCHRRMRGKTITMMLMSCLRALPVFVNFFFLVVGRDGCVRFWRRLGRNIINFMINMWGWSLDTRESLCVSGSVIWNQE